MTLNVLYFILICLLAGSALMALANRTVDDHTARDRWLSLVTYIMMVLCVIIAALAGTPFLLGLFGSVLAISLFELVRAQIHLKTTRPRSRQRRKTVLAGSLLLFAGVATATVLFLLEAPAEEVLFIYLVVVTFDGGSQAVGHLVGRTHLFKRINPEKTVEGALGGTIAAIAAGVLLRYLPNFSNLEAVLAAIISGTAGQAGDLLASAIKRYTGHREFGNWLPGKGGLLDRFDSFFFAAAAWYLIRQL